jgi:hypothetical protein
MFGISVCRVCRVRHTHENECHVCTRVGQEVASLGHAIARFVRRARVTSLVATVGLAFAGTRSERMRGSEALDELEAMAMGGPDRDTITQAAAAPRA